MPDLQITACHSNTGVTCCVKEAKAANFKDFLKREIVHLRRVAHVRPPKLLSGLTKTDSSIAVHYPVH